MDRAIFRGLPDRAEVYFNLYAGPSACENLDIHIYYAHPKIDGLTELRAQIGKQLRANISWDYVASMSDQIIIYI